MYSVTWSRFVRGDVYELKAPRDSAGHEQRGRRYAVVVQSDDLPLSTWLVCPTGTSAPAARFRPRILVSGETTLVLTDQLTAIDPQHRLGRHVGYLNHEEMSQVDAALLTVLGLS